jgi:norsolorinic acid ketoreductase
MSHVSAAPASFTSFTWCCGWEANIFAGGIGRGLFEIYLSRPNHTVIAGVRDTSAKNAQELLALTPAKDSKAIAIKIDSSSETDAKEAASSLQSQHSINHIDVVFANSGIATYFGSMLETPTAAMREHFEVNTVGQLVLFQAMYPLLKISSDPKFVVTSSSVGSLEFMKNLPAPAGAYGMSKTAVNFVARKIALENPEIKVVIMHPG